MIDVTNKHLKNISVTAISMIDRAREDYGDINELKESIRVSGLIHPIAVMCHPILEDQYILLAGGRRLTAHIQLALEDESFEMIPCSVYPYLADSIDQKTIELVENLHRKDMSYTEEVKLTKAIHDLQISRFGKASTGTTPGGHRIQDTADMLGKSSRYVEKSLMLAEAIEAAPALGECKNKSEALKQLAIVKEQMVLEELAARHTAKMAENTSKPTQVLEGICNSYVIKNSLDALKTIPDQSVDFIELDPPYNIELRKIVDLTSQEAEELMAKPIPEHEYLAQMHEVLKECYRILRDTGWIILWHSSDPWHTPLLKEIHKVGFLGNGVPALWIKNNGNSRTPNIHLKNYYEPFFYARKDSSVIAKPGPNIYSFPIIAGANKSHPNEKPIELYMAILSTFCFQNAFVVSPYAGSGNCILAAYNLGLRAVGFDINQHHKNHFTTVVMSGQPGHYSSY